MVARLMKNEECFNMLPLHGYAKVEFWCLEEIICVKNEENENITDFTLGD
jgi:hypothetical protein